MIQFKQSDTSAILILTLTENVSINDPYYLFVFTHVLTGQKVKFTKYISQDESDYQTRYNQFTINPSVIFLDTPVGQWHYKVYENLTNSTDEDTAGAVLEYGKMILNRATAFEFTQYNETQSFKAYNG